MNYKKTFKCCHWSCWSWQTHAWSGGKDIIKKYTFAPPENILLTALTDDDGDIRRGAPTKRWLQELTGSPRQTSDGEVLESTYCVKFQRVINTTAWLTGTWP